MMFFALVTLVGLLVLFHWIFGLASARHDEYVARSATPPSPVEPEAEDPPFVDKSKYIRRSSCCGALGRRKLNGKDYCFDCAHWHE